MKIRVMSDLHLEFQSSKLGAGVWEPSPDDAHQTLVLAGDIDVGPGAVDEMIRLCSHFKYVVRVLGNHEFYDHDYDSVIRYWANVELNESPNNFMFLHNDTRVLDGVRFIGGTMWTSMNASDPFEVRNAARAMNDYECIKRNGATLHPRDTIGEYYEFINYLGEQLKSDGQIPTVVVTHHSPGNPVRRSAWRSGNAYYYADLEQMVGDSGIKLWIHGHTHESQDYMINETRVVCNPYGYHGVGLNRSYDKNLTVEIK